LKLGEVYYKGLLHTTAKTGATGSGNSVPPSLPDRRDTETDWDTQQNQCHRDLETGSTEFVQTEQMQNRATSFQSTLLSPFVINHQ
jgi:hypothetical protein